VSDLNLQCVGIDDMDTVAMCTPYSLVGNDSQATYWNFSFTKSDNVIVVKVPASISTHHNLQLLHSQQALNYSLMTPSTQTGYLIAVGYCN